MCMQTMSNAQHVRKPCTSCGARIPSPMQPGHGGIRMTARASKGPCACASNGHLCGPFPHLSAAACLYLVEIRPECTQHHLGVEVLGLGAIPKEQVNLRCILRCATCCIPCLMRRAVFGGLVIVSIFSLADLRKRLRCLQQLLFGNKPNMRHDE